MIKNCILHYVFECIIGTLKYTRQSFPITFHTHQHLKYLFFINTSKFLNQLMKLFSNFTYLKPKTFDSKMKSTRLPSLNTMLIILLNGHLVFSISLQIFSLVNNSTNRCVTSHTLKNICFLFQLDG